MPTRPHIRLAGASLAYGKGRHALEAVRPTDLTIERGEFVSILGPSGCGKSTLLMMIAGLLPTTGGLVEVDGTVVDRPLTNVGIAFQQDLLFDWRTVMGNILIQADMRGLDRNRARERAKSLLDKVGLTGFENKRPWQLSGGMRQRVALCRSLVHQAEILLMDEPFGALDALTRERINLHLQNLWMDERRTAVMITHSISEAVFLSDRVVVLSPRPGRVILDLPIDLPRPRTLDMHVSSTFTQSVKRLRDVLDLANSETEYA
jgi:NitT/TauT family transport system ATP-binding protein